MSGILKMLKQVLESYILDASNIFIVGHNDSDFDSIGSAIGLKFLCEILGKEAYIIINDSDMELAPGVKLIKEEYKDQFHIITLDEFQQLKNQDSLLIVTDTNKDYLLCVKDQLQEMKNIIVIDHHEADEHTIASDYQYIDTTVSSASEIVAQILNSYKEKYDKNVANFLLAGIILDTNRYSKNTSFHTHDVAEKLLKNGADLEYVNDLFLEEFDDDRKISNLVFYGTEFVNYDSSLWAGHNISFTLNREKPTKIYRKEQLAKAADNMLKYRVDAAFVLGFIKEGMISISARSKSSIDVGKVMSYFHGGGNPKNAGAKIEETDIFSVEKKLKELLQLEVKGNPQEVLLVKTR